MFRVQNACRSLSAETLRKQTSFCVNSNRKVALQPDLTLDRVGLKRDALDRYPHEFSGGQRQRVAIARALIMQPDIIVADEAVSALDVSVQAQVLALFKEVKEIFGLTMLFITHDLRVAADICDRIAVLQYGKLVEIGTVAEIIESPKQDYTRQLIQSSPNFHMMMSN